MKTWEKVILLIKSAGKYTKRKSKRGIALLAAVTMMLSVIPMTAFADAGMDHTTHTGCKALSMGTTYIMIDGVEQANNRLSDGSYYLTGDITATLSVNGNVSLCLNGFSVNADDSKGIKFYESGKSLTVDDCVGTGRISGDTDAIYVNYSNTTVTINGGAIGSDSSEYGIYTSDFNIKVFINGGSVTGSYCGIYNDVPDIKVYLSGTPAISGGEADIFGGELYADNGSQPAIPYSGATLTLADYDCDYHYHNDIMVSHVTEDNKDRFALHNYFTKYSLVYDSDSGVLKLEGEPIAATWYAEDGTTVLSGANYPATVHYGSTISDLPDYEKEGYLLAGWFWRVAGWTEWDEIYDAVLADSPVEFKADILPKYPFEGDGTADSPYLIQNAEDLLGLEQIARNPSKCYNDAAVYYRLTADINLSSVCSETKGNWTPIGEGGFFAQFDGDGHTISNLYYRDDRQDVGLFRYLEKNGSIRNLTVTGFVSAKSDFSGIVGSNDGGTVENCIDLTMTVPYGYTTDENGWMTFKSYDDGAVDVKAIYDGNWIKTSYDTTKQYQIKTSGLDGAAVTVTPTIINGGSYVKVLYTITNNGGTAITEGKLAVHSDIQIGDNDDAAIEIIQDGDGNAIGFRMIDDHTENKTGCTSRGAQLNLYFAGTGGVIDADTYWFGYYGNRDKNAFMTISDETVSSSYKNNYEKDESGNYIKLNNVDSGIAFSWQNIALAAGESKEFSWVINVGFEAEPPQWGDPAVNLTVTTDATQNNRKINVTAKVKDEAGITDKLYYSVNDGAGVLLGGVIADGVTEKNITGVIDTSSWADDTYHLDFWVVNSKGAVSEKVRRTITITDGRITGAVTELNPELSHDWATDWSYDEINHWHDCKNANCTVSANKDKNGFAAHDFDNACDPSCNTCSYTRAISHTFNQKVMTERYLVSAGSCTERAKYYYSCACGAVGTTTFFGDLAPHEYIYSADGAVITETCAGECGHSASATLVAPENRTYDGTAKEATVSYTNGWNGGVLTVAYSSHGNVNVGSVTASIAKNNKTAMLSYDITAATVVLTPPTAKENLVYDGGAKALVNAGSTTGGTMQYAIGVSAVAAPTSGWSTVIPEGQAAGTYYVWYKVVGGTNYNNVAPACITVTMAKAEITVTADNKTKTYGENDTLLTWSVTEGTVKPNDTLTDICISRANGENVGEYTITVSQAADANPNYDITFVDGTLAVVPKEIGIRWSNTNLIYNGSAQKPTATATGTVNGDQITLVVSGAQTNASDTAYIAIVDGIEGKKAGNYKLPAEKTVAFTIAKADQAVPTGIDTTNLRLWTAILFISGGAIITLTVYNRKRRIKENFTM